MKYIATTLATTDGAEQLKIMLSNSNHVNKTYFIKYSLKKNDSMQIDIQIVPSRDRK